MPDTDGLPNTEELSLAVARAFVALLPTCQQVAAGIHRAASAGIHIMPPESPPSPSS